MLSPAFGLGWILWRQHRSGIALVALYLGVLTIVSHLPPTLYSRNAASILTAPFGFGLIYLMGIFVNSDSDMMSTRSGYAYPLFTLPVRTLSLVLWPMLYGTVTVATVWIVFAELVLAPTGAVGFVWWPATLLAALMACLQALSWMPFPLPNLRGISAFFVLAALTGFGALGWNHGIPPTGLAIVYLALIPVAALVAVRGVATARAGENRERGWLPEQKASRATGDVSAPFASVARAQLWLEWKRNGLLLPLLTLLLCVLFALPLMLALRGGHVDTPLGIGEIQVHITVRLWLITALFPLLCALTTGCCPHKAETFRPDLSLQPFLAIRPLSSFDFVLVKLRLALLSTLSAWAVWLLFFAGWLLLPAHTAASHGAIGHLLLHIMTLRAAMVFVVLLVLLVSATWKSQVSGLWVELTGLRWLINSYAIALPMFLTTLIGWSINRWTGDLAFGAAILRALPALAFCALAIKAVAIIGALYTLHTWRLASPSRLLGISVAWLLIAAGLGALLHAVAPAGLVPTHYIFLGVLLSLPFARLLMAPIALHYNRHR